MFTKVVLALELVCGVVVGLIVWAARTCNPNDPTVDCDAYGWLFLYPLGLQVVLLPALAIVVISWWVGHDRNQQGSK